MKEGKVTVNWWTDLGRHEARCIQSRTSVKNSDQCGFKNQVITQVTFAICYLSTCRSSFLLLLVVSWMIRLTPVAVTGFVNTVYNACCSCLFPLTCSNRCCDFEILETCHDRTSVCLHRIELLCKVGDMFFSGLHAPLPRECYVCMTFHELTCCPKGL